MSAVFTIVDSPVGPLRLIERKYKEKWDVVRLETLYDAENEVRGYLAYAKH